MRKPVDYRDRDLAVCRFLRRSGNVGFAAPISEVFFGGKPADQGIRRIADKRLLTLYSKAMNGFTYVQLTKRGFRHIGVDVETVRQATPTVINASLAVSWYCTFGEHRRYRLLSSEVTDRLGEAVPKNVPHVITNEFGDGEPVILRVHLSTGKVATSKKHVQEFFRNNRTKPGVAAPLAIGDYGMLCLCPTPEKVKQLRASLQKAGLFERGRLVVALGPTSDTYGYCLKKRKRDE